MFGRSPFMAASNKGAVYRELVEVSAELVDGNRARLASISAANTEHDVGHAWKLRKPLPLFFRVIEGSVLNEVLVVHCRAVAFSNMAAFQR